MSRARRAGCWGSAAQVDLVRAARGDAGAWLRCRGVLDEMGGLVARLGPSLYRHVDRGDPQRALLKGTYRRAWYANQTLARRAASAIELLADARIPTLLLKGAALDGLSLRAMNDVDVLVRPADAARAVALLGRHGWTGEAHVGPFAQEVLLRGPRGEDLDLHQYVLWQSTGDDDIWRQSEPAVLHGASTRVPAATDLLLIVCVHGLRHSDAGPSWAFDALALLEERPIDWSRLVRAAQDRRLSVSLAAALGHLAAVYGAPVPAGVLAELRATPATYGERAAHRAALVPTTYLGITVMFWERYRRFAASGAQPARPRGFVDFLRVLFGLRRRRDLARRALSKLVRPNVPWL